MNTIDSIAKFRYYKVNEVQIDVVTPPTAFTTYTITEAALTENTTLNIQPIMSNSKIIGYTVEINIELAYNRFSELGLSALLTGDTSDKYMHLYIDLQAPTGYRFSDTSSLSIYNIQNSNIKFEQAISDSSYILPQFKITAIIDDTDAIMSKFLDIIY